MIKVVKESPEHHFLTLLEKLRPDISGWVGMHFGLSQTISHDEIIENPSYIAGKIFKMEEDAKSLLHKLEVEIKNSGINATIYLFSDNDIIVLAHPADEKERQDISALYRATVPAVGEKYSSFNDMAREIYNFQKISDAKFRGARRFEAYRALADANRVQSIPLRRQRRDDALILIVEDDRFTASYAANILNKEYEVVHARNGEEAVLYYIEHAPDMVFLDIHLPGLDGHETLRAIRKADPDSFIIMLSVDTAKESVVSASKSGASGFLKKPFSKERMLQIVKTSPFIKNGRGISTTRL